MKDDSAWPSGSERRFCDEKIVILKADKGNATVVMNTEDYEEKVNSLLSGECTYEKLPTRPNPVNQITSTINQYVWNLY